MRRAGGVRERRRLCVLALSRGKSGRSGGVGRPSGASPGAAWYCEVGGGEVPHPSWICRVGVRRLWRLVVLVEWLSRGGAGLGGPFGVDVVAGRIRFLVWPGGRPLVVGGVVGRSARWVVLPSHALVLLVHGGLRPGGVGWWAVVVVVVVVVVLVVWALVAVALVVVMMVLRVCPEDPLAFRVGLGMGHCLQPLGPYGLFGSGGGLGARLNGDRDRGVLGPRVGLAGGSGGLWGVHNGALGDWDVDEGFDGVVLGCRLCGGGSRWGRGRLRMWSVGGPLFSSGLALGSGRGRICCRRTFCGFWGCVGWCW